MADLSQNQLFTKMKEERRKTIWRFGHQAVSSSGSTIESINDPINIGRLPKLPESLYASKMNLFVGDI